MAKYCKQSTDDCHLLITVSVQLCIQRLGVRRASRGFVCVSWDSGRPILALQLALPVIVAYRVSARTAYSDEKIAQTGLQA